MLLPAILFDIFKIGFSICMFFFLNRFMEERSIPDKLKSSRSQMFFNIGALKNFANFTGKHLCWSLFLIKKLQHRCFPVKFEQIFKNTYFTEHLRWLLPYIEI